MSTDPLASVHPNIQIRKNLNYSTPGPARFQRLGQSLLGLRNEQTQYCPAWQHPLPVIPFLRPSTGAPPHSDVTQNDVKFLNACIYNSRKNRIFINFSNFFQYSESSFCDSLRSVKIIKFGQFYNKLSNFKRS